ncbi:hypothetical protein TNIN_302621 [Trichonephila inaurata madagascariensis]|uniref:Uncharacterized protein n=1 Tax=Trichonephila inaurata madagascariensis TaxID=2747483 RepID=A0A8X6WT18_9ARAC|nr:hypothetical protein TNIN_302621 [Trichonephila inaurata madagascariensis]
MVCPGLPGCSIPNRGGIRNWQRSSPVLFLLDRQDSRGKKGKWMSGGFDIIDQNERRIRARNIDMNFDLNKLKCESSLIICVI